MATKIKANKQFQKELNAFVARHFGKPLEDGDYMKVEQPTESYMPLVIEHHGDNVHIAHFYIQEWDVMHDPEVSFWVDAENYLGLGEGAWIPYRWHTDGSFYQDRSYINFENGKPVSFQKYWQHDLTKFVNTWWTNIREQGYMPVGDLEEGMTYIVQRNGEPKRTWRVVDGKLSEILPDDNSDSSN